MSNKPLPPGWTTKKVGDLVTLDNGFAFKPSHWKKSGLPIIRIQNLNNPNAPFNYCTDEVPARCLVEPNDLLFAWSGTPGTSFGAHIWRGEKAVLNQHIFNVRFDGGVTDRRFLRLAINQNLDEYIRVAHGGAGLAHITKGRFEESVLLIPPLAEQRRIVAKIEELFSDLDAGVAALERVLANLKRYRASVLKAAVEGRLTEEWRKRNPSTEPAAKLLERILAERRAKWEQDQLRKFKEAGKTPPKEWKEKYEEPKAPGHWEGANLPSTWTLASIDQLSVVVRGGSPRPAGDPKYFNGTHTPWITVGTLTADEGVYLHAVSEYLTEAGRERSRFIEPDTLLLTNSGATLGVPKITMIGGCINDGSVALLGVHYPLKLYLHFFLKSQTQRLRGLNQGAAQPNLNTGIVKAIVVPLPPSAEQAEIVAEVDRRLSVADAAETQVEHALQRAARLRQAILKRAFEGKLVEQDPTDEPAEKLVQHPNAGVGAATVKYTKGKTRKRGSAGVSS